MQKPIEKQLMVEGNTFISYFDYSTSKPHILFIHGLGLDKEWFPSHFQSHSLDDFSWIVPDLVGFGKSSKPRKLSSYLMNQQAKYLLKLLQYESIKELIILAHSMGGPIAVSLLESIVNETDINIIALFYLEGNLDKNDTFISSKVAELDFNTFEGEFTSFIESFPVTYQQKLKAAGPFPIWASSFDIVRASNDNTLITRIIKTGSFSKYFVYGEQNKGKFSSEGLVAKHNQILLFIPKAGHLMYEDNPVVFWQVIKEGIKRAL